MLLLKSLFEPCQCVRRLLYTWHNFISSYAPHWLDRHILFNLINQMFAVVVAGCYVMSDVLCHKQLVLHWAVTQESIRYTYALCLKF